MRHLSGLTVVLLALAPMPVLAGFQFTSIDGGVIDLADWAG